MRNGKHWVSVVGGTCKNAKVREVAIVYASAILPFLSTILRDYSIITFRTADMANLFFVNFNIANFIAMIPGEYIWTKYNLVRTKKVHLDLFEFFVLGAATVATSTVLFKSFGTTNSVWFLIPFVSIVLAYPYGILNGLKQYFLAKMVQTAVGFIMAVSIFFISFDLPNIYLGSLVIAVFIFLAPILAKHILVVSGGNLRFKWLINTLLITTIPYACFYITHSIILSANESNSKTVIIGNRISVYLFTFFLMANPIFINMFKHLREKPVNITMYIKYKTPLMVLLLLLMSIAIFLMINNTTVGLILFSFFISVSCTVTFYICKLFVLTKILVKKRQTIATISIILLLVGLLFLFDNKMFTMASLGLSSIAINFLALTYFEKLYYPAKSI